MPQSAPVFDYDALLAFAQKHRQTALIDAANRLAEDSIRSGSQLLKNGRVVDVYRRINSEEEVRANHAGYMYFTRVGDDNNFVGANLVAQWHLRTLEMFARLTRLIDGLKPRVLVLYGQGMHICYATSCASHPILR